MSSDDRPRPRAAGTVATKTISQVPSTQSVPTPAAGAPSTRAKYRALALVPGVQPLGEVHDRLGRAAVGVAFTEHTGLRQELLLDPETAEVLNERQVVAHPVEGLTAAVGTAIEDIVYTRRAVTDATVRP
jgi:hypothetical protein